MHRCVLARIALHGAFVVFGTLAVTAATASGSQPASSGLEQFDVYVDEELLHEVCDHLALDDRQFAIADELWEQYWAELNDLADRTEQASLDAGWREFKRIADEATREYWSKHTPGTPGFKSWENHPWDVLSPLARDAHNAVVDGMLEADALLAHFLERLRSVCTEDQQQRFERVPRLIRVRSVVGRRLARIDLFSLVEAALGEDGELHPLAGTDAEDAFEEVLRAFEVSVDAAVRDAMAFRREKRPHDYDARPYSVDLADPDRHTQAGIRITSGWISASHSAAQEIGRIARERLGDEARDRWIQRWQQVRFPELFEEWWPDRMVAWVENLPGVTEVQLRQVRALDEEYRRRRDVLRQQAVDRAIVVKRRYGRYDQGPQDEHIALFETKKRLRLLVKEMVDRLRPLLTPEQQAALDHSIWSAKAAGGGLLGPRVPSRYLEPEERRSWWPFNDESGE